MNKQDDKWKEMLAGTKLKASSNLQFRIMQQIETEKALSRQNKKRERSVWGNLSILGIMYGIMAVLGFIAYLSFGKDALYDSKLYISALLVAAVCGVFFLISTFDDRRQSKHNRS